MGKSNLEERAARHKTREENKLTIALYRESWACNDMHGVAVCYALRNKYPKLARVFDQIDASMQHFEEIAKHVPEEGA